MQLCHWQYLGIMWCQTDTSGVSHDHKSPCYTSFHSWHKECRVPLMMQLASHGPHANGVTWPEKSCTSFWLSWLHKCSNVIDDAIDMTWCWCWCQLHLMTKKVMLHLLFIILTNQMDWCHWWHCWHHVTLPPASMHHMTKNFGCTLLQLSWPNEYSGAIGITLCWC